VVRTRHDFGYHYALSTPSPQPVGNPVLLVHGGGLLAGSATDRRFDELSRNLALHGLEVLSLEYPLLWQGLDLQEGTDLIHCALSSMPPQRPVSIVSISAGAWLTARALNTAPLDAKCAAHASIDRLVAISPMLDAHATWGTHLISSWLERTRAPHHLIRTELPERILVIHGLTDWLVPEPSSRALCETSQNPVPKNCRRHTVEGGHFLVTDGVPGPREMEQELVGFLTGP
jgi:hypothetical protein